MFVLDCSVTMAWCFDDEASDYADAVLRKLETEDVLVPTLWHLEVLNVLLVAERRGRITTQQRHDFLQLLSQLVNLDTDLPTTSISDTAVLELALQFNLSIYDAVYLALAITQKVPLATQDKKLKAAAQACGLWFEP